MHANVQKSTSTTLPRSASGDSGGEFNHVVAPERSGNRPSTGSAEEGPGLRAASATRACNVAAEYEARRSSPDGSEEAMGRSCDRSSNSCSIELLPPGVNRASSPV